MGAEVTAGGTQLTAFRMVPKRVNKFISDSNNKTEDVKQHSGLDPFCLAVWKCSDFVVVHRLLDGNGRTRHILLNAITIGYAGTDVPSRET